MAKLSIIIVNYNIKDIVDGCIDSIYKSNVSGLDLEIFFVDNHSIDGSADYIESKYPGVIVIRNEKNLGFSKANNIALKRITGDYVLLLNPDTIISEGTFDKLIKFVESRPNIGAVTTKLIRANGELDLACRRSFPTFSVTFPRIIGLSKLFPKVKLFSKYNLTYLDENETYEVDAICGAFMFMKTEVVKKTGLFDEDYFMYGEDLDYCYRIKKQGYKNYYYSEVSTVHLKGESTRKTNIAYVNNFYGAMSIFVKKNLRSSGFILLFLLQLGIFLRSAISYLKRIIINLFFPLIDINLLYLALIAAVKIRFNIFPNKGYLFIITVYVIIWLILLSIFGLYSSKHNLSYKKAFNAILAGFFINSSVTYFFKEYAYSREVVLVSTGISLVAIAGWRAIVSIIMFFKSKNILLNKINLLVVGEKILNQNIEDKLVARYNILYFKDITKEQTIQNLEEVIKINNIKEVIFSDEKYSNEQILGLMTTLKGKNIGFKIIPTGKDLILSKLYSGIDNISLIDIEYNINNKINAFFKRVFDIILSIIILITIYPFVFIKSKFTKKGIKKEINKILDVPSVLKGTYSFVGIPVWYNYELSENLGKPGLTGLIQLYYHEGMTKDEMETYNIYYAKNQSILLDLEILMKTVFFSLRK